MIYFDNAATTQTSQQAADAAMRAMRTQFGNPSSLHRLGIETEAILRDTRTQLAERLHADKGEFIFTSGGTEGNNLALFGAMMPHIRRGGHMIVSAVEHASVLEPARELARLGFRVTFLPPEECTPDGVCAALCEDTRLVSIMHVNNEVGAVYPVFDIARAVRRARPGALIHTDAVQAFLKLPISLRAGVVDLMTVSGHKIHAPKGVGALYIRRGVRIAARTLGGGQEKALRPGTENVPAIAGFGAAIAAAGNADAMRAVLLHFKDRLCAMPQVVLLHDGGAPHILSIAIPGYPSEVAMRMLESRDIYVSSGSACSRGRRSHVLEALHIAPKLIDCALRVSISDDTTLAQADAFCAAVEELFTKQ